MIINCPFCKKELVIQQHSSFLLSKSCENKECFTPIENSRIVIWKKKKYIELILITNNYYFYHTNNCTPFGRGLIICKNNKELDNKELDFKKLDEEELRISDSNIYLENDIIFYYENLAVKYFKLKSFI